MNTEHHERPRVVLIGAGWALGSQYEKVEGVVGPISTVVIIACAVLVLALIVWVLKRRRIVT